VWAWVRPPDDRRSDGPLAAVVRQPELIQAPPASWQGLLAVTELVDTGTLRPVIDRTYPLAGAAAGLQYVEAGHARGKVVITVA
jgi:NADPH:quinone reductase-like Zn-dependent oxidoreductase